MSKPYGLAQTLKTPNPLNPKAQTPKSLNPKLSSSFVQGKDIISRNHQGLYNYRASGLRVKCCGVARS